MALDYDRNRRHTATEVLRRIDDDTAARLETCASAGPALTGERLNELDREWDTDRAIEAEACNSLLALRSSPMRSPVGIRCCRYSAAWAFAARAKSSASATR